MIRESQLFPFQKAGLRYGGGKKGKDDKLVSQDTNYSAFDASIGNNKRRPGGRSSGS